MQSDETVQTLVGSVGSLLFEIYIAFCFTLPTASFLQITDVPCLNLHLSALIYKESGPPSAPFDPPDTRFRTFRCFIEAFVFLMATMDLPSTALSCQIVSYSSLLLRPIDQFDVPAAFI